MSITSLTRVAMVICVVSILSFVSTFSLAYAAIITDGEISKKLTTAAILTFILTAVFVALSGVLVNFIDEIRKRP